MIVPFPDHTHLLLEAMTKTIIDSIALFGTYCNCLTNVHRSNRFEACARINFVKKNKGHKQKALKTDDMEIRQVDGWLRMGLLLPPPP